MSKFKLKKKACIRAVIVAGFVAVVAAGAYSIAYAESYRDAEVKTMQPSLFTVLQSAYVDNAKLIAELTTKRIEAFGMADDAIENYNDVITDEQKDVLHASEDMMMNALSISEYEKHLAVFNDVIKACETERARIEAERIEAKKKAEEEAARKAEEQKKQEAAQQSQQNQSQSYDGGYIDLRSAGVVNWGGYRFTWYSQNVLPGGGLNIPGRHVNSSGFVCDGDGYICAATAFGRGTTGNSPWGAWKSYDTGVSGNTVDLYCNW